MDGDLKVLIVVDCQNDFVDGALGFEKAKTLDNGISELVKQYMNDKNCVVIFTADTHKNNYLKTQEGRKLPTKHCIEYSEGWKIYGKTGELLKDSIGEEYSIGIKPGDLIGVVKKNTFGSSKLLKKLKKLDNMRSETKIVSIGEKPKKVILHNIESITLVGVVTNMCVISNAIIAKAACPESEIIVKKDLVASFDDELHQKALDVMGAMQITIE
jgi:nicotinamidase-related amidase